MFWKQNTIIAHTKGKFEFKLQFKYYIFSNITINIMCLVSFNESIYLCHVLKYLPSNTVINLILKL